MNLVTDARHKGGAAPLRTLRGRGNFGKGRGHQKEYDYEDFNILLPGDECVADNIPAASLLSGVRANQLDVFCETVKQRGAATELILKTDEMSIKQGLDWCYRTQTYIGAVAGPCYEKDAAELKPADLANMVNLSIDTFLLNFPSLPRCFQL